MRFQSILLLAAVAAGTVNAGPPKPLKSEDITTHDERYEKRSLAENSGKDDQYEDDNRAAYANYLKFAESGKASDVPLNRNRGGRLQTTGPGWMATKRQNGDNLSDDIGDFIGDVNNNVEDGARDGEEAAGDAKAAAEDAGDRIENDWNDDGPDGNDGPFNSAGDKSIPLLSVASVVAVSFLILT